MGITTTLFLGICEKEWTKVYKFIVYLFQYACIDSQRISVLVCVCFVQYIFLYIWNTVAFLHLKYCSIQYCTETILI